MPVKPRLRAAYRWVARSQLAPVLHIAPIKRLHRRFTATSVSDAGVVEIVGLLSDAGVDVKLLGGWACDALLGRQTREHADVDLLLLEADRQRALATLELNGFERIYDFDSPALAARVIELTDHRSRRCASLHFTDLGSDEPDGFRGLMKTRLARSGIDSGEMFVTGTVGGREVECLSAPAQLVLCALSGPGAAQRQDIELLRARFSLPAPAGDDGVPDAA